MASTVLLCDYTCILHVHVCGFVFLYFITDAHSRAHMSYVDRIYERWQTSKRFCERPWGTRMNPSAYSKVVKRLSNRSKTRKMGGHKPLFGSCAAQLDNFYEARENVLRQRKQRRNPPLGDYNESYFVNHINKSDTEDEDILGRLSSEESIASDRYRYIGSDYGGDSDSAYGNMNTVD